jgi:hypothetical protein
MQDDFRKFKTNGIAKCLVNCEVDCNTEEGLDIFCKSLMIQFIKSLGLRISYHWRKQLHSILTQKDLHILVQDLPEEENADIIMANENNNEIIADEPFKKEMFEKIESMNKDIENLKHKNVDIHLERSINKRKKEISVMKKTLETYEGKNPLLKDVIKIFEGN